MQISKMLNSAKTNFLEVDRLSFAYEEKKVLDQLSFRLIRGEILGILGPNGAGKTTLFEILTGLISTSNGSFILDGQSINPKSPRFRDHMGVVFQKPSLDQKLSAMENLLLSASLYCLPAKAAKEKSHHLMELMGLSDRAEDLVGKFSGGMKRKLEIARAFIHEPQFLILDEPTTGLDEVAFQTVWNTLHKLRTERGASLLLTTHRADEAERCDRLLILDHGKMIAEGSPEELKNQIGGDVLLLELGPGANEVSHLIHEIEQRFALHAKQVDGNLHVTPTAKAEAIHFLIPKIIEHFPKQTFTSLNLHKPTLADVFVRMTGRVLTPGDNHAKI